MIHQNLNKKKFPIYLFIILYFSLIVGFFLDENLNFGSYNDWIGTNYNAIQLFANNFKDTLLNYDTIGHRHSPIYPIFLSFFYKLGFSENIIRFINLNLAILLIYFFFKCLEIKFKNVNYNFLLVFSFVFFLSPNFRSLSIWPDSRIIGLLFFTISIYQFLKFQKIKQISYFWKSLGILIISSYISPNFSLFIIYYYFYFFNKVNKYTLFLSLVFCSLSAFPALYYLFILDVNFLISNTPALDAGATALSYNFSNKILLISSIISFHLIPFIIDKKFLKKLFSFISKNIFIIGLFLLVNIYFFNYSINFTGGGIFFQFSNLIFKNNFLFYLISFFSLGLLFYFVNKNRENLLIFFILILSNIQTTIYHKYYDLLLIILFFTIINSELIKNFFKKKFGLEYLYLFYVSYILMRIFKNNFIV